MKTMIKKIIPSNIIVKVKHFFTFIDNKLIFCFAHNGFLSSIYYCFFSRKFDREHKAVLQGRINYAHSLLQIQDSSVLLRRNTHRLEKGLIMQPRKSVFALDYIIETVNCYNICLTSTSLCQKELKWAHNVLTEYFSVCSTSNHHLFKQAQKIFNKLAHKTTLSSSSLPYPHKQRTTSTISYQEFSKLCIQRRSVRWFEQKKVDTALLEQAIALASQAPSACNRQPFTFHLSTNMSKASEIAAIAMGTVGFAENIPAIIAIVGDLSAYPFERDRHTIYIDASLAAMQLMLALETLGLSSCPINWPDIETLEQKMAKKLNLTDHLRPIMLIAIGYGDANGKIPFSQKKLPATLIEEIP